MFLFLGQLTDKNWIKQVYQVYYADEPIKCQLIEEKATECSKKYHQKIQHLQSRHAYYVDNSPLPATLTSISSVEQ